MELKEVEKRLEGPLHFLKRGAEGFYPTFQPTRRKLEVSRLSQQRACIRGFIKKQLLQDRNKLGSCLGRAVPQFLRFCLKLQVSLDLLGWGLTIYSWLYSISPL